MATRKALVLVSGLFQELNSSSDKLDFAGNSTTDLSEGSNQYFTNTRARGSISVAAGNGLTYNSSTGVLGTNAIPNSQLANDDITIGSTAVTLGATQGTFTGLTSLASTTLISGVADAANAITIASGQIVFEGSTANDFETTLAVTDPTADRTITFPDNGGTVALTSDIVYPVTLNNSVTLTNKTLALGSNTISGTLAQFNTAVTDATLVSTTGSETLTNKSVNLANNTLTGTFAQFNTAVSNATLVSTTGTETLTNKSLTDPILTGSSTSAGSIIFKEDTDNGTNSATLKGPASTADVTITLPAETGTVLTTASSIANSNLANSTVTIGSSAVALGSSVTTLTGITSLTSDAVVVKANGFRVIDNTDTTKQVAFDASGIATSTTRTLTVPNASDTLVLLGESQTLTNKTLTSAVLNGTISGTSIKDEDNMSSDSASHLATQQSIKAYVDTEIAGISADITAVNAGTGLSGGGTSGAVTLNIDSTVATLTGSQTLTNKTIALGSNTVSGTLAQLNTAVSDATLVSTTGSETLTNKTLTSPVLNSTISGTSIKDEDNMASDSASHLATQQSIKAYVDTEIAGVPQGDITAVTAGTGLSGGGTTGAVSLAIDATVATLTGSQTLTNKTIVLGNNTVSGALADGITATTQSASDNSTKVATTAYVDNQVTAGAVNEFSDNVFRVKDNSDASKKLAFECSGISGSTTRTMTVPNTDGTISTESFATAIAVALG